ncbi:MAG: DUF2441 domain-containing protein [Bacilli bacterium]|nr:DUF2441 domain-containing protein [Bacilli bacterium]
MELYHIHILGDKTDKFYKPNSEIIINKDVFNNKLYDRVMNTRFVAERKNYSDTFNYINTMCEICETPSIGESANMADVFSVIMSIGSDEEKIKALKDVEVFLRNYSFMKREISIEEYRKDFESNKPSRLHCLYACNEKGVNYWLNILKSNNCDIYRIDPIDEPFRTNEQLLPIETSSFIESYNGCKRYFNPREKDLNGTSDEYLVQGKVKLLEKVYEIR